MMGPTLKTGIRITWQRAEAGKWKDMGKKRISTLEQEQKLKDLFK